MNTRKEFSVFLSGMVLIAVGCAGLETAGSVNKPLKTFVQINKIKNGMTPEGVQEALGKNIIVGYSLAEGPQEQFKPIQFPQPQRAEEFVVNGQSYQILYYLTAVRQADDIIADDELTPFIFENGKLVAKDYEYLFRLKNSR